MHVVNRRTEREKEARLGGDIGLEKDKSEKDGAGREGRKTSVAYDY